MQVSVEDYEILIMENISKLETSILYVARCKFQNLFLLENVVVIMKRLSIVIN